MVKGRIIVFFSINFKSRSIVLGLKSPTSATTSPDLISDISIVLASSMSLKNKFPLVAKKNKKHKSKFTIAGVEFGGEIIPTFAGPNMVESRELIMDIAKNIKKNNCHFLRGGAFKPLTFPYRSKKYNETREMGIKWLSEAKSKYNIPIITEVMEEKFLPLVCEVADIIQIGSRNMQNYPFLIACAKTNKPLMLKRHYGSSLRDWLGAAEYILKNGNKKLILCERGVVAPHTHKITSRFLIDLQVLYENPRVLLLLI